MSTDKDDVGSLRAASCRRLWERVSFVVASCYQLVAGCSSPNDEGNKTKKKSRNNNKTNKWGKVNGKQKNIYTN